MADDVTAQQRADHALLRASLALVKPRRAELVAAFYGRLFAARPDVRAKFPPRMDAQHEKLLGTIVLLVEHYGAPDQNLTPALRNLGVGHAGYTLRDYADVGDALLDTLAEFAGAAFTPEVRGAWVRAYTWVAATMLRAGAIAELVPAAVAA
jgi:hemoglobin-like flavoprotein